MADKIKVGVIGPGNIGSDLMYKIFRSKNLEMAMMAGIVESEGMKRAKGFGVHKNRVRCNKCRRTS